MSKVTYYSAALKRVLTDKEVEEMKKNGAIAVHKKGCTDCKPVLIEGRKS